VPPDRYQRPILVVDDEESVGRMVRRHLRGWTITQVFSIEAATDQLLALLQPRLVLLDLNLGDTFYPEPLVDNPFQGSFEVARRIRRLMPCMPVVIFSACSNPLHPRAARLAGAEFLSKEDVAASLTLLRRRLDTTGELRPC